MENQEQNNDSNAPEKDLFEKDIFENLSEGLAPITASDELHRRVRLLAPVRRKSPYTRWIIGGAATAGAFGLALGLLPNMPTRTTVPTAESYAKAGGRVALPTAATLTRSWGRPLGVRSAEAASLRPRDAGKFIMRSPEGRIVSDCPLQHTDVQVNINGPIARVTVTQKFKGVNNANTATEALYTFPLPENAAVDDMTMRVGENRVIRGQIKRREEAREIYNTAKQNGQTASLLDQERDNVFTQSVANIQPNQDVTVTISYITMLKYEDGVYEFTHPMVVGPRYEGNAKALPSTGNSVNPASYEGGRNGHDINLTVNLDAGLPLEAVQSELHDVQIQSQGGNSAQIMLAPQDRIPNKDFILRYSAAGSKLQEGLMTHADGRGGGYFTLILQPPAAPKPAEITPKELIFVIDQTGSQSGAPIEKSKETMRYCLKNLRPNDTFQLIGFNTSNYPCFIKPVIASPENIAQANRFLDKIDAGGGTDILGALKYALQMPNDPDRLRIVSYMTDGYVDNDREIVGFMRQNASRARMFPFGIGNSVNRFLIEGMAREGRGAAEIVDLNADSKKVAQKFYKRMADPLLTNINIDWNGATVAETLPAQVPDVFSSTPIVVKGRYTKAGPGRIVVNGNLRGKPWSRTMNVNFPMQNPTTGTQTDAIRVLWARTKLQDLQTNVYAGQVNTEAVASVALEHRLMSEYTSFVAVDESAQSNRPQQTIPVPAAEPDGVAVGSMGASANAWRLNGPMAAAKSMSPTSYYALPAQNGSQARAGGSSGSSSNNLAKRTSPPNLVFATQNQFRYAPKTETEDMTKSAMPAMPQLQAPSTNAQAPLLSAPSVPAPKGEMKAIQDEASAPATGAMSLAPAPADAGTVGTPLLDKSFGMEEATKKSTVTRGGETPSYSWGLSHGSNQPSRGSSNATPGFSLTSVLLAAFLTLVAITGSIVLWLRKRNS
jgi:Ca-activated chloride channel homolog